MKHLKSNEDLLSVVKSGTWLIDFSASWCGPCQMLAPILEELGTHHSVLGIDVDTHPSLAEQFSIFSVPTLILMKEGKEVKRVMGFHSLAQLEELFEEE